MDADDRSMNNASLLKWLNSKNNPAANIYVSYFFGNNKSKIQAINANMENGEDFDLLLLASDDMIAKVSGYDDIMAQDMLQHFPDFDGALHYNDGRIGRTLDTLSIMGKKMYDGFGYIYHPDYISLWCDNEFTDVIYRMGKAVYLDKVIIKHDWTGQDHLYRINNKYYDRDRKVYLMRKEKGFPKECVAGNISKELPPRPSRRMVSIAPSRLYQPRTLPARSRTGPALYPVRNRPQRGRR